MALWRLQLQTFSWKIRISHCPRVCCSPCNFVCDQSVMKGTFMASFNPYFDISNPNSVCGLFQFRMLLFCELVENWKLRDWLVCATGVLKMRFWGHFGSKVLGQNRSDRVDWEETSFHNRQLNQKLIGVMIDVFSVALRIGIRLFLTRRSSVLWAEVTCQCYRQTDRQFFCEEF